MPLKQVRVCREIIDGNGPQGTFYQGDVLPLLAGLTETYAEQVKLIYLDPPFRTGERFEMRVRVGEKEWRSGHGTLALEAYRDPKDLAAYLNAMRRVLAACRKLLRPDGMLFLHVDYRANAHLRLLMDEIFGEENFLNEIIWTYQSGGRARRFFSRKHDVILFYRKTKDYDFNMDAVMQARSEPRGNHMRRHVDPDGRVYRSIRSGGKVYTYYDDDPVAPGDVWDDLSHLQQRDPERTGYDTQKPLALLSRIVRCASREGELVMDLFAGASTTLAAAAREGRPFVGVDKSPLTVGIARRRLSDIARLTLEIQPEAAAEVRCEANVLHGVGLYRVELADFAAPNPSDRAFEGLDLVDSWAVGYLEGETFRAMAQSLRTSRKPALETALDAPVYEGRLAVRVSDVFGRNYYFVSDDGESQELNNQPV